MLASSQPKTPSLREATQAYLKVGLLSFGGPAAQISMMYKIFVDEKNGSMKSNIWARLAFVCY